MNDYQSQYQNQYQQEEQNIQHQIYVIQEKEKKILMILDSLVDEEFQVATEVLDQLKLKKQKLRQLHEEVIQNQQQQQYIQLQQPQVQYLSQMNMQQQSCNQGKPKVVKKIYYIDGQMVKQEDNLNESLHFGISQQEKDYTQNMLVFKSAQQQKENQPIFTKQDKPQQYIQNSQQKVLLQSEKISQNSQNSSQKQSLVQKLDLNQIEQLDHPRKLSNTQLYSLYKQGQFESINDNDSIRESQRDLLEELYIKQVLHNLFPEEKVNYGAINYLLTQDNFDSNIKDLLKNKFYTPKPAQKQQEQQNEKIRDMIDIYQSAQLKLWEKLDKQSIDVSRKDLSLSECEIIMNNSPQDLNPIMINQLLKHEKLQDYFQENMGSFLVEQINYINLRQRLKDYDLSQHNIQYEPKPKNSSRENETFQIMSEVNLDTKKVGYFQSDQKLPYDLKFNNFDTIEEESIEGQTSKVQDEVNDSMHENFQNYSYQKNNFQQSSNSDLKIQNSYQIQQCKKQEQEEQLIQQKNEQLEQQMRLIEEAQNLKLGNSNIKKFKEDYDINIQISLASQSQKNSVNEGADNDYLKTNDSIFKNLLSKQNSKQSDKQIIQNQEEIEEEDQSEYQESENNIEVDNQSPKPQKMSLKNFLDLNLKMFNNERKITTPKSTFSFRENSTEKNTKQPNMLSLQATKNNRDRNKDLIEFLKIKIKTLQNQIDQMKGKKDQKSTKKIEELELKRSTLDEHVTQISQKNSFEPHNRRINIDEYQDVQINMKKKPDFFQFETNRPHQVESLKYTNYTNFDNNELFRDNIKKSIQIINNK